MRGLQLPICTEIHSLNSCVQLASLWCAYRGFRIPCRHFWRPTAFYCLKSHPRFVTVLSGKFGLLSPECPTAGTGGSHHVHAGPSKLRVLHVSPGKQTVRESAWLIMEPPKHCSERDTSPLG